MLIQPYIPSIGYNSLKMSTKQKILSAISAHPKFVAFGIGLAITFAIGTAIGMLDHSHMALGVSQAQSNAQNG